jgi:GntR family transcriptional regulator, transcriptional repressor for pyruvate dehydrogenase complex
MQIREHQDIITVLEYRQVIEKGAIGLAVTKATAKDLPALEEGYADMLACVGDAERFAKADVSFHRLVAQACRNPILIKVYDIIDEILDVAMVDIVRMLGCEQGIKYHRLLIDALKKGDKAECEALMGEHIETTIRSILALGNEAITGASEAARRAR